MYELRNYQEIAVDVGVGYFHSSSIEPSIEVLPTAAGKSLIIGAIANRIEGKTICVQPSIELLEQNVAKFKSFGGECSIYSASAGIKQFGDVTYATIGSIQSIGSTFKQMGYRNLIIDEVHLYPRNVNSMLRRFLSTSSIKKVLGLTATPFKLQSNLDFMGEPFSKLVMLTSKSKKGNFFKKILHVTQIQELTEKGYWCPLEYDSYSFGERDLKYNSTKAEFTEDSILKAYEKSGVRGQILEKVRSRNSGDSVLVFVPSVAEAIHLASKIPKSAAVYGDMDKKERKKSIEGFKDGSIHVVFNVNVLSVGYDHPWLNNIVGGRPTASLAWFYQAMGRGVRTHPGKEKCTITDFVGNIKRFGRIEDLYFKKESIWKLYGSEGRLLTGIPLHEIGTKFEPKPGDPVIFTFGKHSGKSVEEVMQKDPGYLDWILKDFSFKEGNLHIREEIIRLKKLKQKT